MGHEHSHGAQAPERKLWIALGLTGTFLIVEATAGFLTHSLALLSDATHMLTDVAALGIALAAIRIGRRVADHKRSFGYYRFEILAAAFNAVVLFLVAFYILFEAIQRFRHPTEIASLPMLAVAVVGLIVNLISMRVLRDSSSQSLNVKRGLSGSMGRHDRFHRGDRRSPHYPYHGLVVGRCLGGGRHRVLGAAPNMGLTA